MRSGHAHRFKSDKSSCRSIAMMTNFVPIIMKRLFLIMTYFVRVLTAQLSQKCSTLFLNGIVRQSCLLYLRSFRFPAVYVTSYQALHCRMAALTGAPRCTLNHLYYPVSDPENIDSISSSDTSLNDCSVSPVFRSLCVWHVDIDCHNNKPWRIHIGHKQCPCVSEM